jgi:hypothetical protein
MALNKIFDNNSAIPLTLGTLRVDGTFTSSGTAIFTGGTQATVGIIARQSQTGTGSDIQQWQRADGTIFGRVDVNGELQFGSTGSTVRFGSTGLGGTGTVLITTPASTYVGLTVKGIGGQTNDLVQIQNSAAVTGAKIDASSNIFTNSYYGITGSILPTNIYGVVYADGSAPAVSASGGMSTNAGYPTPVMLPNEEGYYPYWGFKTPNRVEWSDDGTNWTSVDPTAYKSLFAFQNGSYVNITHRAIRFTFYQPTFTFLSLISARYTGGTNLKTITLKTETLASDYSTVLFTWGPEAGVVGYDGAAAMQKVNQYSGNIYATRVTMDMAAWVSGNDFQVASLMAYLSKPGTGFGFQNKFPISWDTYKTVTLQPNSPGSKGLVIKGIDLSSTITAATANGTTITYTTSAQHAFLAGHFLNITGIVSTGNPSATANTGFNFGSVQVASVISQTQFTVTNGLVDTYTSGGTAAVGQGSNLQEWQSSSGFLMANVGTDGRFVTTTHVYAGQNIKVGSASMGVGGGVGVMGIANATTVPTSNPTGGGVLYVDTGALKYIGTSGTAATIVNADGTGGGGGGGAFTFSTTAPTSPVTGDRWTDSNSGIQYTYVNDGSSSQWAELGVSSLLTTTVSQSSLSKTITSTAATTISTTDTNAGSMIQTTATSAVAITITNTLTAGQFIDFVQYGSGGQITFSAGTGVTLVSSGTKLKTSAQYAVASVQCLAAGIYLLFGDLSA